MDARACNGELIRSADTIKQFVIELCDLIQMKRFGETTVVYFGEDEKKVYKTSYLFFDDIKSDNVFDQIKLELKKII